MLSVIKTALVTIIISFISGVLLDTYKNFAPRIICSMRRVKSNKIKNKASKLYIYTVTNSSNKILHDININVQAPDNSLEIEDARISSGLKFDLVNEKNTYNVSIPFLSKDDEFSLKLSVNNNGKVNNKPIINLRSPEAFKIINYGNKKMKKNKRISDDSTSLSISSVVARLFHNRKLIITIASVLLIIYGAILGIEYYNDKNKANTTVESTNTEKSLDNTKDNGNKTNEKVAQNKNNNNQKKPSESKKEANTNIKSNNSNANSETEKENGNIKSNTKPADEYKKANEDKKMEETKENNDSKNGSNDKANESQEKEPKDNNNKSNNNENNNNNNSKTNEPPLEDKNGK